MLDALKKIFWGQIFFIRFFFLTLTPLFVGRAFGGLRLLWGWLSLLGQLPLRKFSLWMITHIIVIDWCCMCKKSGETPNYLIHCDAARELSNMVFFQMFGVEWVIMPRRWLIFWCVGIGGSARMTSLLFWMQFLPFYCGAFGEKGMLKSSMIKSEQAWINGLVFLEPFLSGSLLPPYSMSLAINVFVLFFYFSCFAGCFLLYGSWVSGLCSLCF